MDPHSPAPAANPHAYPTSAADPLTFMVPPFPPSGQLPEVYTNPSACAAVAPFMAPPSVLTQSHPPYAEMITAAITSLNEKDGSSRQAIAKYIEKEYPNLPLSHSTLLTYHLKCLKNDGQLVMVKHSYMLPRSLPTGINNENGNGTEDIASLEPKKRPGRPPKLKPIPNSKTHLNPNPNPNLNFNPNPNPNANPNLPHFYSHPDANHDPLPNASFDNNFQLNPSATTLNHNPQLNLNPSLSNYPSSGGYLGVARAGSEALLVSLGLVDGPAPAKRGRGRPPKNKVVPGTLVDNKVATQTAGTLVENQVVTDIGGLVVEENQVANDMRQIKTVAKRGRGRPPREKSLPNASGQIEQKRRPGRPPKSGAMAGSVARARGRPKNTKVGSHTGKPHGRLPKNKQTTVAASIAGGALVPANGGTNASAGSTATGVLPAKRPGRQPNAGGVKKVRKLSGKPLGRPRKNPSVPAVQVTNAELLVAYQDLKSKLDDFQSGVQNAVTILKPYFSNQTAVPAFGALQELEQIATMNIIAPLNIHQPINVQEQPINAQAPFNVPGQEPPPQSQEGLQVLQ